MHACSINSYYTVDGCCPRLAIHLAPHFPADSGLTSCSQPFDSIASSMHCAIASHCLDTMRTWRHEAPQHSGARHGSTLSEAQVLESILIISTSRSNSASSAACMASSSAVSRAFCRSALANSADSAAGTERRVGGAAELMLVSHLAAAQEQFSLVGKPLVAQIEGSSGTQQTQVGQKAFKRHY